MNYDELWVWVRYWMDGDRTGNSQGPGVQEVKHVADDLRERDASRSRNGSIASLYTNGDSSKLIGG